MTKYILVLFALLGAASPALARSPVAPAAKNLQISDFLIGKTCSGAENQKLCLEVTECPAPVLGDFFSFNRQSICLSVSGKAIEMFAPTPSSDAARIIDADMAQLKIPVEWLQETQLRHEIPVAFSSHYFTGKTDLINGVLYLGPRAGGVGFWQAISGPFQHFQERQGLGRATIIHTRFGKDESRPDYQYTLYSSLGEPLVKTVPIKDAHFLSEDVRSLIDQYRMVDGYSSISRFDAICYGPSSMANSNDNTYTGCKVVFNYSPFVALKLNVVFSEPLPRLDFPKWLEKLGDYVRPLYIDGRQAYVEKPDAGNNYCKKFNCW